MSKETNGGIDCDQLHPFMSGLLNSIIMDYLKQNKNPPQMLQELKKDLDEYRDKLYLLMWKEQEALNND